MKSFAGRGGPSAPKNAPDSYFSDDVIEVVLGLTEGPIKGLKDGTAKNFYVGETPLLNANGDSNFENFELKVHKGSALGELIVPRLGGQSTSLTINSSMSQNVPIIRQGTQLDIDWLELRFVINQLVKTTKSGSRARDLDIKVEYKPSDEPDWLPGILYVSTGTTITETDNSLTIIHANDRKAVFTAARQQVIYDQTGEPDPTTEERALGNIYGHRLWWLDASKNLRYYSNGDFFAPDNLVMNDSVPTRAFATFDDPNYIAIVDPPRSEPERTIHFWTSGVPTARIGDLWWNGVVLRWHNGASWTLTLAPQGDYDPSEGHNVISTNGILHIHEKISSSAVREVKIKVDRIGVPYDVRLTKLSPDTNDLEDEATDVTIESIQEIKAEPMRFPGLSVAHLVGRASDQFSSLPQFSGVYEGRLVKVPSNYNPVTRTYVGAWDGTWKVEYTTNPAYIGNDLVMNDEYGMNSTYPVELEPFDVYEAGVWCDLERGDSGKPQFTFNQLIQEPQSAREMAVYIFGIFGGRFFDDGNGYARLRIDNDSPAVHLFAKENVKEGVFRYSYTETEGRKNDYTVAFKNPALHYKEDRRRVRSQPSIDAYGRVPDDFIAVGCNNADEAIFRAAVKLITDQTEVETVTFETAREGLYLEPYDVILVSDDAMDEIISGRISGVGGTRHLLLRDPIYLEAGFEHEIVINTEGFEVFTAPIAPASMGMATTTLQLLEDLPGDLPAQAVFSIGVDAKPYRVLGIGEGQNAEEASIVITAIEVNRTKYAEAGGSSEAIDVDIPDFPTDLAAVKNPRITPSTEIRFGRAVQNLLVEWDAHPNKFVRSYIVASRFNDDPWVYHGPQRDVKFELADVLQGRYVFSIQPISMLGQKGMVAFVDIDLSGDVRRVPPVTDLTLTNEVGLSGSLHLFEEVEARFQWNKGLPNPALNSFQVKVYSATEVLLRTQVVTLPEFVYTTSMVRADSATRQLKVEVVAYDVYGNSSEPVAMWVKNPAPAAPLVVASNGFGSIEVTWSTDGVQDYVGSLVWLSNVSDFDPEVLPPAYDIIGNQITSPLEAGMARYIRVAIYDSFGKTELNVSGAVMATSYGAGDFDAPDMPTGLVLTSTVVDGVCKLVAVCDENDEPDLAGYIFAIKEGAGNYVGFPTNTARYEWTVTPGVDYAVTVLAYDQSQNKSDPTDPETITAALDTVPPATPTGVTVQAGLGLFLLKCDRATEADFSHYEIYQHTAESPAPVEATPATYTSRSERTSIGGFTGVETRSFWMRAVDTSGNKSDWSDVATGTTGAIPEDDKITIDDITFTPGADNTLAWTAGSISYGPHGVSPTTQSTEAGSHDWTSGKSYVYYVRGNTSLSVASNLTTVYSSNGIIVGIYKGGTDFQLVEGKAKIDGGMLIAQTVGANSLVTGSAVITGSAQIADAIINDGHVENLSAAKLIAGSAMLGSIIVNGRAMGDLAAIDIVMDDMTIDRINVAGAATGYYSTSSGNVVTGSRSFVCDNDVQGNWTIKDSKIPFDPTKLYKITHRVRRSTVVGGLLYLGLYGYDAAGVWIGGQWVTLLAQAQTGVPTGFTDYVGWVKGTNGLVAPNVGTVDTPAKLREDIRYISPAMATNVGVATAGDGGVIVWDSAKIETVDENAAAIVNAGTTLIEPGRIKVSGSTTLASWTHGGDNTLIDGGKIAANTIHVNMGVFGLRGIDTDSIKFEHNDPGANQVSWTAGTISYIGDDGNIATRSIAAGSTTWSSGSVYITYVKGATTLSATTVAADAYDAANRVILAIYKGGTNLSTKVGQTVIDGSNIKTGSLEADKANITSFRTAILVADSISATMLQANSVGAKQMVIADTSNIVPNPTFNDGTTNGWATNMSVVEHGTSATLAPSKYVLNIGGGVTGYADPHGPVISDNGMIPVAPGEVYYMSAWWWKSLSEARLGYYQILLYDRNRDAIGSNPIEYVYNVATDASGAWKEAQLTIPNLTNVAFARFRFAINAGTSSIIRIAQPVIRRAHGGKLIVEGGIKAIHVDAVDVRAAILVAGSVTTDMLTVGASGNYLENTDLTAGTTGWFQGTTNGGVLSVVSSTYTPPGGALQVLQNNTTSTGYSDIYQRDLSDAIKFWDVVAGEHYQFSLYMYAHRCNATIYIEWRNAADAVISYSNLAVTLNQNGNPASRLSNYSRQWVKGQAPATAVKARVFVRKLGTLSGANSFLWSTRWFFGSALPNQTEPSAWTNTGVTRIGAGHISVPSLSAITATIGTFQTAAAGPRVVISDAQILIVDAT